MEFLTVLYVLGQIVPATLSTVTKKKYGKFAPPVFYSFFTLISCVAFYVVLFFIQKGTDFSGFSFDLIKYAIPYGLCFALATIFIQLSVTCGDVSLTGLFSNLGLLIPTFYGIFFLHNSVSLFFWIGLVALCISLVLINVKFGKGKSERKPITAKWLIFALLGAAANGFSAMFQTMQQTEHNGNFGTEMMVVAFIFAMIFLGISAIIMEKGKIKPLHKTTAPSCLISGVLLALNVFFVSVVIGGNLLAPGIYFPVVSGGGLLLTFVFGRFLFKEKYESSQYVGLFFGLIAVVLLNL